MSRITELFPSKTLTKPNKKVTSASVRASKPIPPINPLTATHINVGGSSKVWRRSEAEQVLQVLLTGTFENRFYVGQKEEVKNAHDLFVKAIKHDADFFTKALIFARNRGYMRTLPVYGLALLASAPKPHLENAFNSVIRTPVDLEDFMTIIASFGRGMGGRRLKRIVGKWITNNVTEYWAMKYSSTRSKPLGKITLKDIIIRTHPKAVSSRGNKILAYILGKDVNTSDLVQLDAFEELKKATTEGERAYWIREGKLPRNVADTFAYTTTRKGKVAREDGKAIPSKTVWAAIVENMGALDMLKNLRTIEELGLLNEVAEIIQNKLNNQQVLNRAMILPYKFLDAEKNVSSQRAKDICRRGLEMSFANLPDIIGRTAFLLDVSPSMKESYGGKVAGDFSQVSAITGVSLAKKARGNSIFIVFGGSAEEVNISTEESTLVQADKLVKKIINSTSHGAGIDLLIRKGEKVDNMIMITDGEHVEGRTFAQAFNDYRAKVNPNVKAFIVDISSHRDAVAPKDTPNVYYTYGWSDQVLGFISLASKGFDSLEQAVREGAFDNRENLVDLSSVLSDEVIA